jgi:hypothetical protein
MNKIFRPTLLLFLMMLVSQSCSNDTQPKTNRIRSLLSSGEWKLSSVVVDGIDRTQVYADLALTFTETAIIVKNRNEVWPENQTWKFTDDSETFIARSDGLQIRIEEISETALKLSLTWTHTTFGGGRSASIKGVHVFSLLH